MKRSYTSIEMAAVVLALTAFLSFGIGIAASYSGPMTSNSSTTPVAKAVHASATHAPSVAAQSKATPDNGRSDLQVEEKTKPGPHRGTPRANIKAVAPGNDNCANATAIVSCPFTDTVDTTDTTDEMGEPESTCTDQFNSVWYTYTAPAGGAAVTVDTCNSDFDTALMVWRVTSGPCNFATLEAVVCNDDFCGLQSSVTFLADPGQTYKIQAGGFDGDTGSLVVNVACEVLTCPVVTINGTLGSNDPSFPGPRTSGNQTGRLNRNGIASTCAAPKTCLIFTAVGARAVDAYTFTNASGATACVTVVLNVTAVGAANYQSNAYLGSYDPANICTNYLADPGLSSGGAPQAQTSYSFNVAAGATFVVNVHTTNPGETGGTYVLEVAGNICAPPAACTLTCPANITVSNDPNQCGAVVNYPPPTTTGDCGTVTCSPPSGSFFPKGTTTVTCTGTVASTCMFTITVNDTQPPTITCPANVTAKTPPGGVCATANFTTTASDNCPGVTVACTPASGSCFPVGTTTVTCTATDASNNTATCSFTVSVFNVCLQDDSNPAIVFLGNSLTGAYRFCCGGTIYTGVAQVTKKGSVTTFQHNAADRRVVATNDDSVFKGTASIQSPPGTTRCTIGDKDTRNNNCACGAAPPPPV